MLNAANAYIRCCLRGVRRPPLRASASPVGGRNSRDRQAARRPAMRRQRRPVRILRANAQGQWSGFDVDFCRAVAGAILDDPSKVTFVPLSASERFEALRAGRVDLLSRNSTWTLEREAGLGLAFAGITYHDGQGFMVMRDLNVTSALELNDAKVCVETGTTSQLNLADFFRANSMTFEERAFPSSRGGPQGIPVRSMQCPDERSIRALCGTPETHPAERRRHPAGCHLEGAARAGDACGRLRLVQHRQMGEFRPRQCGGTRHLVSERSRGDDVRQARRAPLRGR